MQRLEADLLACCAEVSARIFAFSGQKGVAPFNTAILIRRHDFRDEYALAIIDEYSSLFISHVSCVAFATGAARRLAETTSVIAFHLRDGVHAR